MNILFDFYFTLVEWEDETSRTLRTLPDVRETLMTLLENGHRLSVVSNWSNDLKDVLDDLKLSNFFSVIVASEDDDINSEKPDSKIFLKTIEKLQVPKETCLYIGDNYVTDYVGAKAVDIFSVLIDTDGWRKEKYPHVLCLGKFTQIPSLVKIIERHGNPGTINNLKGGHRKY